ncbi:MAG: MerR family transcriptional regulator [Pirellulales bacterium]|nr:MerR family transcriptional regulator [Pirellulales bacterium]
MSETPANPKSGLLQGKRVALVGKLAGMARREAAQLLRQQGAILVERPAASLDLIVLGEDSLPLPDGNDLDDLLDESAREAAERGSLRVVTETQLWNELGLVGAGEEIHHLYTPAMLAELLQVPLAVVRRWHRRGLIVPAKEVRKLPYFDFQEVVTARRLAQLLAAGMSPEAIERKLAALARLLPGAERPLAQLSVIIEGKQILLRQGDGLVEPGGQLRFDFDAAETVAAPDRAAEEWPEEVVNSVLQWVGRGRPLGSGTSPEQLSRMAEELEEEGQLEAAAEMLRAAMAAGGPSAELCFQVAELLYRLGDLSGARERYYMTIELDEDYVEARANLGCVLAELGQRELALAALEGALAYHPHYAEVHYHSARILDDMGRPDEAEPHWRGFLEIAPDSPWAEQARRRLGDRPGSGSVG